VCRQRTHEGIRRLVPVTIVIATILEVTTGELRKGKGWDKPSEPIAIHFQHPKLREIAERCGDTSAEIEIFPAMSVHGKRCNVSSNTRDATPIWAASTIAWAEAVGAARSPLLSVGSIE
jgi:hypothetical protein